MAVLGLDHVNLRIDNPAVTIAFFRDTLQMRVGGPGGMEATDRGGWVYDSNDIAIVHIASSDIAYPSDGGRLPGPMGGTGVVHHVALKCSGYDAMKDRLTATGVDFYENDVARLALRQIFVREPSGMLLELNFANA